MGKEDEKDPSKEIYCKLTKEATKLEEKNSKKANMLQKAYEAAVTELGYSDKQMMNEGNAKNVARLMFSDKYLGNAKFNPLLSEAQYAGFAKKDYSDQQQDLKNIFGLNTQSFVATGGIIDHHHGGLGRASMAGAIDDHYSSDVAQKLSALAWQQLYAPDAPLGDKAKGYLGALNKDPILLGSGAKIDPKNFDSVDDVANALITSAMGRFNKESLQYKYGAQFN